MLRLRSVNRDDSARSPRTPEDDHGDPWVSPERFLPGKSAGARDVPCLYDLDRFDGDVIVPIVRAHPKVWMNRCRPDQPVLPDVVTTLVHALATRWVAEDLADRFGYSVAIAAATVVLGDDGTLFLAVPFE